LSHSPRERLVRSPEEIAALWRHLSPAARIPCGLCLLAGLRVSEAMRADQSWVRREQRELWVRVRKEGDPIKTALVDTLAALLPTSGPVVTIGEHVLDHELERASKAADIAPPLRGPGVLRHHCATWPVEYGDGKWSEHDARLVLGHRTTGVTARYVRSQGVARKRLFLEEVERLFLAALG